MGETFSTVPAKGCKDSLQTSELPESDGQRKGESVESPNNVFGIKWQEIPESELAPWQKRAVSNANRSTGGKSDLRAVRPSERTKGSVPSSRFTAELFRVFRKRVGLVGSFNGNPPNFDGAVHPDDTNTIIIDADATSGWTYLLGHELGHSIQHQQPELYDALSHSLLGMAKDWSGYRKHLSQTYDTKAKLDAGRCGADFAGREPLIAITIDRPASCWAGSSFPAMMFQ